MASDLRQRILSLRKAYEQSHGTSPLFLHVGVDEETELYDSLPAISPRLAERAFKDGVRAALPKILGMTVVYGAPKFCVTGESPIAEFTIKQFRDAHRIDLSELPSALQRIRAEAKIAEAALRKGGESSGDCG